MKGVLLINLGTPDSPAVPDVRRYLRQFLLDPLVIDIPAPARWFLVHALILPRRPQASAAAYQQIWTERGSPLLFHTLDLAREVAERLAGSEKGSETIVEPCMRYGSPSIESALSKLRERGATEIVVLPLYPQYSLAATESSLVEMRRALKSMRWDVPVRTIDDFFVENGFIESFVERIGATLSEFKPDHLLFSFHGLPERHVKKTDKTGSHCLASPGCCDRMVDANRRCYRAQCFATARELAKRLGLADGFWSVSFQSRLGRTPWIKPYTDLLFEPLAKRGVRRLAVACPAFVADCLETLEEIQIRGREHFKSVGGEDLRLVPSLNSSAKWASSVVEIVTGAKVAN